MRQWSYGNYIWYINIIFIVCYDNLFIFLLKQAKAQGKDILGAVARGEVKNEENATENAFTEANEEDEEHAFRQEDNKDGLVINECYICQTTLCNSGIATSTRIVSAIASLLFIELFF